MPRVQRHGRAGVCFGSYADSCLKACKLRSCSAFISPSSLTIYGRKKITDLFDPPSSFMWHPIIKNNNKWCHGMWVERSELMTGMEPQRSQRTPHPSADYCTLNATSRPTVWNGCVCVVWNVACEFWTHARAHMQPHMKGFYLYDVCETHFPLGLQWIRLWSLLVVSGLAHTAILAERWDPVRPSARTAHERRHTHAKWLHLCIQAARWTQVGQITLLLIYFF